MRRAGLNPLFIRSSIPLGFLKAAFRILHPGVSIPYSSGHLFRSTRRRFSCSKISPPSLNPLFIRSSIPFGPLTAGASCEQPRMSQSLIHQVIYSVEEFSISECSRVLKSLNPLFIRSSIPLERMRRHERYSSGMSQSLIHQVIYSVKAIRRGDIAMARQASQSLIHQVIYSVLRNRKP